MMVVISTEWWRLVTSKIQRNQRKRCIKIYSHDGVIDELIETESVKNEKMAKRKSSV